MKANSIMRIAFVGVLAVSALMCSAADGDPAGSDLAIGTWGGENSGAIVTDTLAHVHIGCTYGDVPGRVHIAADGTFSASGTYLLRAYPIAVGPVMPAQFTGSVIGTTLTVTVTVNDTIEHKTTVVGPAKMTFGKDPAMGPCPICRTPGSRALMNTEMRMQDEKRKRDRR